MPHLSTLAPIPWVVLGTEPRVLHMWSQHSVTELVTWLLLILYFGTELHYVAQTGLELVIFLFWLSKPFHRKAKTPKEEGSGLGYHHQALAMLSVKPFSFFLPLLPTLKKAPLQSFSKKLVFLVHCSCPGSVFSQGFIRILFCL